MAEQVKDEAAPEQEKRKLPLKTIIILAAVLLVEAAVISAVFLLSGGPAEVRADGNVDERAAVLEQPVEVLVIADKFQNTRTGRAYLYDTEIYIEIRRKHQGDVEQRIDTMRQGIKEDIAKVFRKAEPAHLLETELSTIRRQIRAALDERLGRDEQGEPYVERVVIPKCHQFRADM